MKLGNVSFGLDSLNVVASGVKTSTVSNEPQLVALSTKGGFAITPAVSKALNLASGDNIMFVNNSSWAENEVAQRTDQVVAIAQENGLDLDNPVDAQAIVTALTKWFIGKAYAKKTKTGKDVMSPVRLSAEEKAELLKSQLPDIVANNREALIEQFGLASDASDEEIASHVTVDNIATPEAPAYVGAKLASNGNVPGIGLKLSFSDTSTWEQMKSDLEDKTAVKRVFDIDLKGRVVVKLNNGYEDIDVTLYPVGDYTDEKPVRVGKKSADTDAEVAE